MIEFRLDPRSGVPTYLQLVHQVKQAAAPRDAAHGRPAADGQGGRRDAGDQPQHGAQGLPRARPRRARGGPARAGDLRRRAGRSRSAGSVGADRRAGALDPAGAERRVRPGRRRRAVRRRDARESSGGAPHERRDRRRPARQALRHALGAARLHARGADGVGDGPGRPQRRGQDDAPASHRRADRADGRQHHRPRRVAARAADPRPPADRVRRPGPSAGAPLPCRRDAHARPQAQPALG